MSATTSVQLPAGTWELDPVHSTAAFAVKHTGVATFRSGFKALTARLEVAQDGAATLSGSVDVASIDIENEQFKGHVLADDFFAADQHPQITFASDELTVDGDRVALSGRLTMRGVTQPITATGTIADTAEDLYGNTRTGLQLETTLDRTQYGVSWNAPLPKGGMAVANDVTLTLDLALVKA